MFFSRTSDAIQTTALTTKDRLSHLDIVDLLDKFRASRNLTMHTLTITKSDSVEKKENPISHDPKLQTPLTVTAASASEPKSVATESSLVTETDSRLSSALRFDTTLSPKALVADTSLTNAKSLATDTISVETRSVVTEMLSDTDRASTERKLPAAMAVSTETIASEPKTLTTVAVTPIIADQKLAEPRSLPPLNVRTDSKLLDTSKAATQSSDTKAGELKTSTPAKTISANYFIYEDEYPIENKSDVDKDAKSATNKIKKKFIVIYISRDQDRIRDEDFNYLPLASEVIEAFYKQNPNETATLLLPIFQCGAYLGADRIPVDYFKDTFINYLGLARDHIVLAEAVPTTKQIEIHDSQATINSSLYLNNLTVPGFDTKYSPHGSQQDRNMCGYYVYCYVRAYLQNGDATLLKDLKLDPEVLKNKKYFLENANTIIEQVLKSQSQQVNTAGQKTDATGSAALGKEDHRVDTNTPGSEVVDDDWNLVREGDVPPASEVLKGLAYRAS